MEDMTRPTDETSSDSQRPLEMLTRLGARMTRRDMLRRAVALGLAAPVISALVAACGGDDDEETPASGGNATATTGGGASPTTGGGAAVTPTTGTGGGPTGGTFVVGRNLDDLITFDPSAVYEISSAPIMWAAYQTLIFADGATPSDYYPVLAAEVPTMDNGGISSDGLIYTFKLREGVKFHTGKEMKAADWVFAMKRIFFRKGNPSFLTAPFATETDVNVEAVDDYTLKFTLIAPNPAFLAYLNSLNMTAYDSEAVKALGGLDTAAAETEDAAVQNEFNKTSFGAGPYKLTSFKEKEEVVMERHADYYGDAPAFEKWVLKYIADSGQEQQQLEGDEIQIAMELDGDAVKSVKDKGFAVVEAPSFNHTYIALHHDPTIGGPLADIKVRQAIAQAIDYDAFVNDLRGGAAVRPACGVPLGMLGTDKVESKKWVQNVEAAKALIAEAGVEGEEITFSFGAGSSYDGVPNETSAAKLKEDIEAIGLKVKLNPMDPTQRLADFRAALLQMTISSWAPDYVDVHAYALPFGGVKDEAPAKRIGWVDEENTKLLADGIKELDPAKREEIYVKIQEKMIEDAGFIVLWQPVFQYAHSDAVDNVVIHPVALLLPDDVTPA